MKLKYFLRGLGVGILFSAIVLALSFYNKPKENLTEAEILERARKLGLMTEQEWKDGQIDAALGNMGNQAASMGAISDGAIEGNEMASALGEADNKDGKESGDSGEKTDIKDDEGDSGDGKSEEASSSPKATKKPDNDGDSNVKDNDAKNSDDEDENSNGDEEAKETPVPSRLARIEVRSGMVSSDVAEDLQSQGIVEDAYDFDQYMCDNGFAPQIQAGTFYVPKGANYLEIAKILMGE